MKTRNNNYLQMANEESNIDRGGDKMNLLKTFNSKRLKKSCSLFLSSIVTLSILSVANTSFAFPAQVRTNSNLYALPDRTSKKVGLPKISGTILDVLYCRQSKWCYILGFYSQGTYLPIGYYPQKGWTSSESLCEGPVVSTFKRNQLGQKVPIYVYGNDPFNPLPPCNSPSTDFDLIFRASNDLKTFFCDPVGGQDNPWQWLLKDGGATLCR